MIYTCSFYGKSLKTIHVHHMTADSWVVEWRNETWSLPRLSYQHPAAVDPTMPFWFFLELHLPFRPTCFLCECCFRVHLFGGKKGEYDQNVMVLCVRRTRGLTMSFLPNFLSGSATLSKRPLFKCKCQRRLGAYDFYACMMYVYVWVCSSDHCPPPPPPLQSMRQHLQYLCLAPPAAGGGVTGAK